MIALPTTVPPASTPPPGGIPTPALPTPGEGVSDDFGVAFAKLTTRPALDGPAPLPEVGGSESPQVTPDVETVEEEGALPLLPTIPSQENLRPAAIEAGIDQIAARANAARHEVEVMPVGAADARFAASIDMALSAADRPATVATVAAPLSPSRHPALAPQVLPPVPPEARPAPRGVPERADQGTVDRLVRPFAGELAIAGSSGPDLLPDNGTDLPTQGETELPAGASVGEGGSHLPVTDTRRMATEHLGVTSRTGPDAPPPTERQIVTAILSSGSGRTDILLDPQDLGRVRLSLEGNETGLVVTVVAERAETADLLRRNADLLMAEFRDAGYTNLSFSFSDRGQNTDGWPGADAAPDGQTTRPETFPATEPARPLHGTALLDLRL